MLKVLGAVVSRLGWQRAQASCLISVATSTLSCGVLHLLSPGSDDLSSGHCWLSQLAVSISVIVPRPARRWQYHSAHGVDSGHLFS